MGKKILGIAGLLLLLYILPTCLMAEVKLPPIFGDNMVLQQLTDAAIWGKSTPDKTVRITTSWDNKNYAILSDNNGSWKIKVKTPSAGGPFEITISDGKTLTLKNVLIGEVWVCSGQSNMGMTMKGGLNSPTIGSTEAIATSFNKSIRYFAVGRNTSLEPLTEISGKWNECISDNVASFSAVAFFFGQIIQKVLNVPVGLISSSWGGTSIEAWMGENGIKKFDFVTLPVKDQQKNLPFQPYPKTPTILFNAMIHPIVGYAIRGALWYQGEDNVRKPDQYLKLMPGLIENWRDEWGIGEFPFYYVQIAPFDYGTGINSAFLREAQLKASLVLPNTGMACLMDIGEKDNIHPGNKKVVGQRLSYLALAKTYGKGGFEYSGPVLKEMSVEGSIVKLTFEHAKNGLTSFGKELINFTISGENKRFYPAKAFITNTGISIFSPSVDKPVAVRYAFENFAIGDLYNTEGLPASSFRTDDWEK
jgi:sialate O-acetylesterase